MGFLISQEYYFTEVVEYSSIKTLMRFNIPFTQSGYLISYDGIVEAGIDMTQAKVEKAADATADAVKKGAEATADAAKKAAEATKEAAQKAADAVKK